ncbi:hypothetical protein [Aeromonas allosaccharophila]|uniref:hypothetical protein n=1 Tax=Aeromonas allosaccharophila TaxID=656 RepID=UPI002ADF2099|nr:hypothetical protein [Aeromonas allosaccharophila]
MSRLAIGWLLLWCSGFVSAATLNVTFTVKNDGTIVVDNDWGGTFDYTTGILSLGPQNMPSELRQSNIEDNPKGVWWWLLSPVGKDGYARSHIGSVPMSMRLLTFIGLGPAANGWADAHGCSGYHHNIFYGQYYISTTKVDYNKSRCRSHFYDGVSPSPRFMVERLEFVFFELQEDGVYSLLKLKRPAGKYFFQKMAYSFLKNDKVWGYVDVNAVVIIEPSLNAISMPSELTLDVKKEAGMLIGQGVMLASVTGSLGRNLKIEPRASIGPVGKLSLGNSVIPYNLDVTPQGHDYARRTLVDGQSGQLNPVMLPLEGSPFDYQLRFDVNFRVPVQGLQNGRYQGALTLIFTTSDI